jgi:hypothetical protein
MPPSSIANEVFVFFFQQNNEVDLGFFVLFLKDVILTNQRKAKLT